MILAKMGPHMKDEHPRTDQQICEDVLKKRRMKGIFLSDLGTTSSMTSAIIPEFEGILEDHEQESLPTSPRYQQLQARIQAVEEKTEDLKRKQTEYEALHKSYDDMTYEIKSRQQEMDALLGYLLRTCKSSS